MGYRSDVYIKVNKHDEEKLTGLFMENDIEAEKEFEDGDYVGYVIHDVKWYDSYKEVEAINSFIGENSEYPRGLISIGEDNAVEEHGKPWELDMRVINYVSWGVLKPI